jgi:hypothetical protein
METLIRIAVFALLLVAVATSTLAQDAVRAAAIYNRTDFPRVGTGAYEGAENVNGYTVEADVQVFNKAGVRGSLAYDFKHMYDVEVFPDYPGAMGSIDLYRNVSTHTGFAQLGYTIKDAFEPFAALGYGTRKIHEAAPRQTVRTFRLGVNILFSKESHFFVKAYVDFEKPFGALSPGFVNPNTKTLGIGLGFRFGGGSHEYKTVPSERVPPEE